MVDIVEKRSPFPLRYPLLLIIPIKGDAAQKVNDIVRDFRLQPSSFDKASYEDYLRGYLRKVVNALKWKNVPNEEVITFQRGALAHRKRILDSFEDWEFYTGESMDENGMVVLLSYREDGNTPFAAYWKHGLEEMKV
ncbi:uncharacterized protein TRUGW13939_05898 [Talaromyces rugulosus]|uniref:Translationally-controlled tumor protein homolog n=1 Tax=Talaromyces rugulosus TaxID=121627 RepID=A0A7H8QZC7_TALRU|nr:uncharacterized protein TRUGW13939_05898 [Talaromyces rugulosus]QKX58771.1 hypothetical protein TRUGW13939_05898 [Talaromyces rugulosus]